MIFSRFLILLGALALLAGGLYATLDLSESGAKDPTRDTPTAVGHRDSDRDDEISALSREIALLRTELSSLKDRESGASDLRGAFVRLEREVAALRAQVEGAAGANPEGDDAGPPPFTPEDMELIAEEEAYRDRQHRRLLAASLQAEPVDASWAPDTTDHIMGAFEREELAQTKVYGVECRSSSCRLEVDHADVEAAGTFDLWFPVQVGSALPQIVYYREAHENGSLTTVMYLAREGYSLPDKAL